MCIDTFCILVYLPLLSLFFMCCIHLLASGSYLANWHVIASLLVPSCLSFTMFWFLSLHLETCVYVCTHIHVYVCVCVYICIYMHSLVSLLAWALLLLSLCTYFALIWNLVSAACWLRLMVDCLNLFKFSCWPSFAMFICMLAESSAFELILFLTLTFLLIIVATLRIRVSIYMYTYWDGTLNTHVIHLSWI